MIRINFCKTGASVSDWDIDVTVGNIVREAANGDRFDNPARPLVHHYSNFLLLDALRAEIAEDKISLDNISFSVDDVPLEVNKYGVVVPWPRIDNRDGYGTRTLMAAMNKRKAEKEVQNMERYGVKTDEEVKEKIRLRSAGGPEAYRNVQKEESSSLDKTDP